MTNSRNPPHPRVCLSVCCWGPGQPGHQGDDDENYDADENVVVDDRVDVDEKVDDDENGDDDENVYVDVSYQVLKRIKWVVEVVMMIRTFVIHSKRCNGHLQGWIFREN